MRRKPILLIDQDDVLAEYIEAVTTTFNERFDGDYTPEDCTRWDLVSVFGDKILEIMHEPHIFRELKPVKHSIETFKRLYESELFEMYIVTAAKACSVEAKHEWLRKHMPFLPEKNVIVCMAKYMIKGDYLLDDGMHNIEAFNEAGGKAIVFNRPHNRKVEGNYMRVDGWLEFEEYIINECYPHLINEYFEYRKIEDKAI